MEKVLIVSVGGSCQPVVTAIQKIKPDRVIFFCSGGKKSSKILVNGTGNPCEIRDSIVKDHAPNILLQTGLEEKFDEDNDIIIVDNPDEFTDCYEVIEKQIEKIKSEYSDCDIIADYTGGTKTMSASLAMASIDHNISELSVTTGERRNLTKIENGQFPRRIDTSEMYNKRRLKQMLPKMLNQFNYPAIIEEIETLMECHLSAEGYRTKKDALDLYKGLDAWDRFDHATAIRLIEPLMGDEKTRDLGLFLKRVIASRKIIDQSSDLENVRSIKGHGYEIVEDLLLNAERRASQERYDDAVGRIYRALELTAQLRLRKKYNLLTGDIDINNLHFQSLPEEALKKLEEEKNNTGKIQIPLMKSFILLSDLGDEIGKKFKENEKRIKDTLEIRNYSLFAHGFSSIKKVDYKKVKENIVGFIEDCIRQIAGKSYKTPVQFPQKLDSEIWNCCFQGRQEPLNDR